MLKKLVTVTILALMGLLEGCATRSKSSLNSQINSSSSVLDKMGPRTKALHNGLN